MSYTPQPQVGRGASLTFTPSPSGSTATSFLSLVSLTPPASTVGEVETTLLASNFEDYVPTIPAAEGSFKVQHWDGDPGCLAMQSACSQAPVPTGVFLITLPSSATLSFPGYPKKYAIDELSNKDVIMAEIDYRKTGVGTYTPAGGGTTSNF
jgi:hypothetical protein